jgi:hypothetical protein
LKPPNIKEATIKKLRPARNTCAGECGLINPVTVKQSSSPPRSFSVYLSDGPSATHGIPAALNGLQETVRICVRGLGFCFREASRGGTRCATSALAVTQNFSDVLKPVLTSKQI